MASNEEDGSGSGGGDGDGNGDTGSDGGRDEGGKGDGGSAGSAVAPESSRDGAIMVRSKHAGASSGRILPSRHSSSYSWPLSFTLYFRERILFSYS